jgi:type II secretory pathway pseudopilin PulG
MTLFIPKRIRNEQKSRQRGFSVLEMIMASAILMVGIVSVMQLVPASLRGSLDNRMDTLATVIAQRELDQMLGQPLSNPSFTDNDGHLVNMGGAGAPGAAVAMNGQSVVIDFTAATPPTGFYIAPYVDPNDPNGPQNGQKFELRWAVFSQVNNGTVISKRIIIGCRRMQSTGDGQLVLPVTLDTLVQK